MKFAIVYGSFKSADGFVGPSKDPSKPNVLDVEPAEAEKMDPGCTEKKYAGHTLKPLDLYEAERKGNEAAEAAKKDALEKADKKAAEAAKKDGGK